MNLKEVKKFKVQNNHNQIESITKYNIFSSHLNISGEAISIEFNRKNDDSTTYQTNYKNNIE